MSTGNSLGAPGDGNWSEFSFEPRGGRYNPDEHYPAVSNGTVSIDTQNGPCAYAAGGANLWCAENSYLGDAPSGTVVGGIAYFGSAVGSVFDQRGHR